MATESSNVAKLARAWAEPVELLCVLARLLQSVAITLRVMGPPPKMVGLRSLRELVPPYDFA